MKPRDRLKQKLKTNAEEAETELLVYSPEILSILWQVKHILVVSINKTFPPKEGRGIHQRQMITHYSQFVTLRAAANIDKGQGI